MVARTEGYTAAGVARSFYRNEDDLLIKPDVFSGSLQSTAFGYLSSSEDYSYVSVCMTFAGSFGV